MLQPNNDYDLQATFDNGKTWQKVGRVIDNKLHQTAEQKALYMAWIEQEELDNAIDENKQENAMSAILEQMRANIQQSMDVTEKEVTDSLTPLQLTRLLIEGRIETATHIFKAIGTQGDNVVVHVITR